jgi:hypothetical protein
MAGATIAQTDQDVQREVQLELKWDARVSPNEIGVAVRDGVVTLSGTVDSYTSKWSAERAALRVRGVRAVVNKIQVRLEGDDQLSDVGIAEAAARASRRRTCRPRRRPAPPPPAIDAADLRCDQHPIAAEVHVTPRSAGPVVAGPAGPPARADQHPRAQPHRNHDRGVRETHLLDDRSLEAQQTVDQSSGAHVDPLFRTVLATS